MQNKKIFLIGFMGAGKTTLARRLSHRLSVKYIDTDHIIENTAGKSIARIFSEEGEDAFRQKEESALKEAADSEYAIVACGGGIVTRKANIEILKNGIVVYLRADQPTIEQRTAGEHGRRPLLAAEDPAERIKNLLKEREPIYREVADIVLDTGGKTIDEITVELLQKLNLDTQ